MSSLRFFLKCLPSLLQFAMPPLPYVLAVGM